MSLDPVKQLGTTIGQLSKTQEDTKDAINPNEENAQRQYYMSDTFIVEQLPLIVKRRDVSEESIWDRGTAYEKWDNPLAKWSDGVPKESQIIHTVYNDNNLYKEYFLYSDLNDTSITTATWGSGKLDFPADTKVAQSLQIAYSEDDPQTYISATLKAEGTNINNGDYYLSADGGTTWESVTPTVKHYFTQTGTDLRFNIDNDNALYPGWPTEWEAGWGEGTSGPMEITKLTIKYETA